MVKSQRKCLAVDMGASSGRVVVGKFDGELLEMELVHRFQNIPVKMGGTLYWDILNLFRELNNGIRQSQLRGHHDISSVGVDAWGNDFGLLDGNGRLLENPVHYRDTRSVGMMDRVLGIVDKRHLYDQTGIQFMRFNALYHLYSMVVTKQPILEIASALLTIPDLMVYFLSGEKRCEFTNVTTTQMFCPFQGDWARALLDELAIPKRIFGPVVWPGTVLGRTANVNNDDPADMKIISVAQHDTASAVVAVPAETKDFVFISSGTWSLVGTEVNEPIVNDSTFRENFTNEGGAFGMYLLLKNVAGLWVIQECKRYWDRQGEVLTYAKLGEMARDVQPFKCLIDPDYPTFGEPGDMPLKISRFCADTDQEIPHTKGEFVRCVLESLAFKYRHVIQRLEHVTGKNYNTIHIIGGGVEDKLLCTFTANACKRQVIAGPVEATAVGNAALQIATIEHITTLGQLREIVSQSFETQDYYPAEDAPWEEGYVRFSTVLTQSAKWLSS